MADVVPTDLPEWNTSLSNAVEPSASRKLSGYAEGEIPTAGEYNWNLAYRDQWIAYLYARTQTYATIQALYAGITDGSSAYLGELTVVASTGINAWGSEQAVGLDGTVANTFVAGNGPFLVLATASGEPRVVARYAGNAFGGLPTLFTLTRDTAATNSAIVCRGDYCAVASGNRVDLFVISTGVRLWSYDHTAQVYDVAIFGDYVCYVASTAGGVRVRRLNIADGTSASTAAGSAGMVGIAATPYGWVVQLAGGISLYDPTLGSILWSQVVADYGNTVPRCVASDFHGIYIGASTGFLSRVNVLDGSVQWSFDLGPAVLAVAIDHGGLYAALSDGAGDDRLVRMDKNGGAVVYNTDTVNAPSSIHVDGAGLWLTLDGAKDLTCYIRGNRPGAWMRVTALQARYLPYPWLTHPIGEE